MSVIDHVPYIYILCKYKLCKLVVSSRDNIVVRGTIILMNDSHTKLHGIFGEKTYVTIDIVTKEYALLAILIHDVAWSRDCIILF